MVLVSLSAEAMVGRPGYKSGVRPNHRMPWEKARYFVGSLRFTEEQWLRPGKTLEAEAELIVYRSDLMHFEPGFRWILCEANLDVGEVELLSRSEAEDV